MTETKSIDQSETSISTEKHNEISSAETPIQNMYSFWYIKRNTSNKNESYEKGIKEIGDFKTVQGFWGIYNHLMRPNDLPNTMDYHLFKTGIKPMWEDASNRRGGKWMIRLRKGIASRYWEDLIFAIIGEQFDVGNEICGAVISVRYSEDIISLWNRNADNLEACSRIRDTMRKILNLPTFVALEYKRHDASLSDNSSFRNTTYWRSDKPGTNPGEPGHSHPMLDRSQSSVSSRERNDRDNRSSSTSKLPPHRSSSGSSALNSNSRYSKEKFEKPTRNAWSRDSRDTKRAIFSTDGNKENEDEESDQVKKQGSERSTSSEIPNAWHQK